VNVSVTPYNEHVVGVGMMTTAWRVTITDTGESIVCSRRGTRDTPAMSADDVGAWLHIQFEESGELPLYATPETTNAV